MNDELLIMHGILSQMPETERKLVESAAQRIREIVSENPVSGLMAVAWIGLEIQSETAKREANKPAHELVREAREERGEA